jgi:FlaA1/EpsC-like NDP-sugar epimerase
MLEMGEPVRIVELAENLIRLSGLEPYKDVPIVFTGCGRARSCTRS